MYLGSVEMLERFYWLGGASVYGNGTSTRMMYSRTYSRTQWCDERAVGGYLYVWVKES